MSKIKPSHSQTVFTIGHSARTIDEFIRLLQLYKITLVVDVRTIPRSMHNPQFNGDVLPEHLKTVNACYIHMAELGGLRHAKRDSINTGWRNASFRGYADYMQMPEFKQAIGHLIQLASKEQIAIMCAEAVPWRCHRSLIEDALFIRGIRSEDIINANSCRVHSLTSFAKVQGTQIIYPEEDGAKTK